MDQYRKWIVLLIGCLLLGVVDGQEMWAGTRAGMSPDEVVQLVPNAYRDTGGLDFSGQDFRAFDSWPGMSLQARLERVEMLGQSARVIFGFINNGLERVVLTFFTDGVSPSEFDARCRTLRAALHSGYGPEGSVREEGHGTFIEGATREYFWILGQTEVKLACHSVRVPPSKDWVLVLALVYHHLGSSRP
jgi:hypothetical protein